DDSAPATRNLQGPRQDAVHLKYVAGLLPLVQHACIQLVEVLCLQPVEPVLPEVLNDPVTGVAPVRLKCRRRELPCRDVVQIRRHPLLDRRSAAGAVNLAGVTLGLQLADLPRYLGFGLAGTVAPVRGAVVLESHRDPAMP